LPRLRRDPENFAVIVNTLPYPVTVEFKGFNAENINSKTITIEPDQTSWTHISTTRRGYTPKVGSCDDSYKTEHKMQEFSNATLSQYTICSSFYPRTYAVLASSATCSGDYPDQETTGW
jgi:hypothetical protein